MTYVWITIGISALFVGIAGASFIIRRQSAKQVMPKKPFPCISGDPLKLLDELNEIFSYAEHTVDEAITWYSVKRGRKRFWGWALRAGIIIATALAGLIPIFSQLFMSGEKMIISPAWSTVALGVGGLCLAFDKFAGYTSGWIRFMTAQLELKRLRNAFCFDWQSLRLGWDSQRPSKEQAAQMLAKAKTFVQDVDATIRDETNAWASEFQAAIRELDLSAKAAAEIKRTGAINVKVPKGDELAGGWTLAVDGNPRGTYRGLTASLNDLTAGTHVLRIAMAKDGKELSAEKAVNVPAGQISDAEISLSDPEPGASSEAKAKS